MTTAGRIILLNGSSSAGKSTLALKLQQLADEPYQHIALDQFRDGLPMRVRGLNSPPGSQGASGLNIVPRAAGDRQVTDILFGSHGRQVLKGMRRAIAAFALAGNHVIVDDLLFEPAFLQDYIDAFVGLETWFVGVRCDLEVVEAREATRIGRFPGTANAHFEAVHAHGVEYDIEVDTTHASVRACAEKIFAEMQGSPRAFSNATAAR